MNEPTFERSPELKHLFNKQLDSWKRRHNAGLDELARRCGVSSSYLSHIGRYGRIPGKPILLLLALNFELPDAGSMLQAARVEDPWPFGTGARIGPAQHSDNGFLSVKLDMSGFTEAIRSIVKEETTPKSIQDLTRGRPLRMGLNLYQSRLVAERAGKDPERGLFVELCEMLSLTLRAKIDCVEVPFVEYPEKIRNGEIDLYGPKIVRPNSNLACMSAPFCRIGLSALVRKHPSSFLEPLPEPESVADVVRAPYKIAVLRNSRSHLFANVALKRSDNELVICETMEEAIERTLLTRINRPVHLTICNSVGAVSEQQKRPSDLGVAFSRADSLLELSDNCIAVRPDWPEVVPILNQSIAYLLRTGAMSERFKRWLSPELEGLIQLPVVL